jgi:membrane protein implicated in regulation of membrane protease activity
MAAAVDHSAREWSRLKYQLFLLGTRSLQAVGAAMTVATLLSVVLMVPMYRERREVHMHEQQRAHQYVELHCSDVHEMAYAANGDECFRRQLVLRRGEPWQLALVDIVESTRDSLVEPMVTVLVALYLRLQSAIFVAALLICALGVGVAWYASRQRQRIDDQRHAIPLHAQLAWSRQQQAALQWQPTTTTPSAVELLDGGYYPTSAPLLKRD